MSNIFTYAALRRSSDRDLHALYRQIQTLAAKAPLGSPDHQTAMANLDIIQRVLNERHRPSGPSP